MFWSVDKAVVMLVLNMNQKNDTLWNFGDARMNLDKSDCEIIGNVFDNPELMNE